MMLVTALRPQLGDVGHHGLVRRLAGVEELLARVDAEALAHEGGVVVGATRGLHLLDAGGLGVPAAGQKALVTHGAGCEAGDYHVSGCEIEFETKHGKE